MAEEKTTKDQNNVGFLDDDEGNASSMRLMSIISLLAAIGFGYMELMEKVSPPYITAMFLLGAFAPKALQKFIEDKAFGGKK